MVSRKSPEIENLLTKMAGISRQDAEDQQICTWCKKPVTAFKDDLSTKEYTLSGFCQACQDKTFEV